MPFAVMLGGGAGAVCRVMMGLAVMEKLHPDFRWAYCVPTCSAGS